MAGRIRVAVVGYGNVGRGAVEAVECSIDMALAGVVRRDPSRGAPGLPGGIPVVDDIGLLGDVDVAIMCGPSRLVPEQAPSILERGISTVDSFDVHGAELLGMKRRFHEICLRTGAKAIVAAGWDPGTDSVIRATMLAMTPRGITCTNFGPGMSMGHTVAVKAIPGVRNALSLTIPAGNGRHRRHVYVELEQGAQAEAVATRIRRDPYFIKDETTVEVVSDVSSLEDQGHGTVIERKGVAGMTHNQLIRYELRCSNPALTAQVMVSAARAATKLRPGAYTLIEVPPSAMLNMDVDEAIMSLV
ncbi:MAG: diaminopimelate dehydrogenase [Firmicutes bacterium]|nr:diaminopimelate dehydrogenase [Bacillota bacterium]